MEQLGEECRVFCHVEEDKVVTVASSANWDLEVELVAPRGGIFVKSNQALGAWILFGRFFWCQGTTGMGAMRVATSASLFAVSLDCASKRYVLES